MDTQQPVPLSPEATRDFELMGVAVPPRQDAEADVIEVWEINWPIVDAFLALGTQWRAVAIGGGMAADRLLYLGLDYAAALPMLAVLGLDASVPRTLEDMQALEQSAAAAMNGGE